ncbi:MAG: DUF3426 domain-containing protein [Gammaproteobacteria bacterium]|nr:DUF3426 domain-containing protein [Gammaproteobacteria bacterium]
MITICPQCQLPLAVTAADLRIAQGQVRCGRCAAVFNALASLYEPGGQVAALRPTAPPRAATQPGGDAQAPGMDPDARDRRPPPTAGVESTAVLDIRSLRDPAAATGGAAGFGAGSGLFRAPPRDDEPRFDDTHGADDWPEDVLPGSATAASPAPEPTPPPPESAPPSAADADAAAEPQATAADGPPPDAALEPPTDSLRLPDGAQDAVPAMDGDASQDDAVGEPAATPARAAGRDWAIDTMMAAELAALVARAQRDEPPELASIRIAVDESSEITVLPSESPSPWPHTAEDETAATADYPGDRSLPRLSQASDDDPDLVGARREAAERRAAMPSGSALRWLELEPAPPSSIPLPDTPAATSTLLLPAGDEPAPVAAAAAGETTAPLRAPPAGDDARPGAFAAALGLDADLTPRDAPVSAADAVVADLAAGGAPRTAATPRWMWAATALLGLALAAQLAHLYREELAGVPALQEPLTRLYAALGRPLQPRWELGRYELRQQGVVAEPIAAGTLTVRASIRNGAERAQPAPMLRVTLQDRFGNRVATRDLTPREYGGAAAIAPAPMLAPGQRIDAEVSLLDPGGEAVGFELDVCLRRTDASIACANDAAGAAG